MFGSKPYVVPQKAVEALFARPTMDDAVIRLGHLARSFMDIESGFLDLDATRGEPASVAIFEGNMWRHLAADVEVEQTANDNKQTGKGDGSVAA